MESFDGVIHLTTPIPKAEIERISQRRFGDMIKAVVDIQKRTMAIGGELHADEEQLLLDHGSVQRSLWGINIYHGLGRHEWIEFDSMINIRPSQGNRSRTVEDEAVRKQIVEIVNVLIED